jgi:hypothetical protein
MMTDSFEEEARRRLLVEQFYSKKRIEVERNETQEKLNISGRGFAAVSGLADSFYKLSGSKSKAAFKVYQLAKSGETVVSTATAAMSGFAQGMKDGGPWAAAAYAAAAVAAGAVQLQAIWSASSDGGSASAGSSAGPGAATYGSYSPVVTQPVNSANNGGDLNVSIHVQGNVVSEDRWIEERLAPAIKDLAVNRNVNFGLMVKG